MIAEIGLALLWIAAALACLSLVAGTLFVLPGGSNTVFCRILGIPDDVVDEELRREGEDYYASDIGSANGTLLNGQLLRDLAVRKLEAQRARCVQVLREFQVQRAQRVRRAVVVLHRGLAVQPLRLRVERGVDAIARVLLPVARAGRAEPRIFGRDELPVLGDDAIELGQTEAPKGEPEPRR